MTGAGNAVKKSNENVINNEISVRSSRVRKRNLLPFCGTFAPFPTDADERTEILLTMSEKKHSFSKRLAVMQKTKGRCIYCGDDLHGRFDVDHFIPIYNGGGNEIENLVPSCKRCNTIKGKRTIDEFKKYMALTEKFTESQIRFVESLGFIQFGSRLEKIASEFRFWFEKEGIKIEK